MTWEPVGVFERFTERARRVVVRAQEESRALGNDHVGTEHILLGLLGEEGLASRVLGSLQVTVEDVRKQVARTVASGEAVLSERNPFTPGARKVLVRALGEALSLGQNNVGTEHILLGLLRDDEDVAVPILLDLGVSEEMVRSLVLESLSEGGVPRPRAAADYTTDGSTDARPAAIDPASRVRSSSRLPESLASLSLADQFVLLTLERPRGRVRRALKVAGLPPLREITDDLARRQLVRARPLHHPEPKPDAPLNALRKHLSATVWSVERPEGAAAELLLLVAFAGAFDGVSPAAHLNARHRISSLGDRHATPPPLLAKMLEEARVETARELATKLLPGRVVVRPGDLDPGVNGAVMGGGHGGGTLGGS